MAQQTNEFSNLNKEQKEAVFFKDGPLLIVAGAGAGKTTVIAARICHLIESEKISPEEILGLTFTDKAACEMEERVERSLSFGYTDLWLSTFHSFCERILKEHGLDIGLSTDFKLLDQTGTWLLARRNLDRFNLNYYRPLGNPTKFISALIEHFSRCKDEGISPENYLQHSDDMRLNLDEFAAGSKAIKGNDKKDLAQKQQEASRLKEIATAYHIYQRLLLENNTLDFGDLINYCLKLFKERPAILERYRQQFKYILVDEFQDTNWAQYELVKLLAKPRNNLTVCADDDQSVYQWRGASFNNVLQFRKDYPKTKEVILTANYRSCQNILDLSYNFIQLNNPNRLEYQINQNKELSQKAKTKGVDISNFKQIKKKLIATKKQGGIIQYLCFKTVSQEIEGVVKKIIEILNSGAKRENQGSGAKREVLKQDKKVCLDDFAILARTNEGADAFSRALERAGLPYQFLASKGLYSKPIILDIICYFKLLTNCYESSSLYRLLNLPFLNLPSEDIVKITQHSHRYGQSIYETLQQLPLIPNISTKTSAKVSRLLGLIQQHREIAREKLVSEVFIRFLEDSGYLAYLAQEENKEGDGERFRFLDQFYEKIKHFEESEIDPKLSSFVEQLDMEMESGSIGSLKIDPEAGPETIKVMTIHSAKGLEFKYVFLVNLVDKRFPSIERKEQIEIPETLVKEVVPSGDIHLQEERRLFYVALTRAKDGLFLTSAEDYGGMRKKKPSRFLYECGLVKKETKKDENSSRQNNKELFSAKSFNKKKASSQYSLPSYFSYTQLVAFGKCPLQYKFAHILKIPRPGSATLSFGKTIHNTLFQFVNLALQRDAVKQGDLFKKGAPSAKKLNVNFEELLEIYQQQWIDEWYKDKKQKQEYYKTGKALLKAFYNDFLKTRPNIKFFSNKPAIEQSFNLLLGEHTLKGKIDRVDELQDGTVEIIDYKTGKPKPEKKLNSEDKTQLLIYQLAAEQVLDFSPAKLTYYYLDNGSRVSFLGTEKDKQALEKKIIAKIEAILSSDLAPTPGWQCESCDFKKICEHRKAK